MKSEKIAALDLGADDYVEKPFAMGELLARMRTALRHSQDTATSEIRTRRRQRARRKSV